MKRTFFTTWIAWRPPHYIAPLPAEHTSAISVPLDFFYSSIKTSHHDRTLSTTKHRKCIGNAHFTSNTPHHPCQKRLNFPFSRMFSSPMPHIRIFHLHTIRRDRYFLTTAQSFFELQIALIRDRVIIALYSIESGSKQT